MVRDNEELLFAPLDDIISFISADELNVSNEELVWEFAVNWIALKEKERKCYVSKLLNHIRIGLMRYEYFNKKVTNRGNFFFFYLKYLNLNCFHRCLHALFEIPHTHVKRKYENVRSFYIYLYAYVL